MIPDRPMKTGAIVIMAAALACPALAQTDTVQDAYGATAARPDIPRMRLAPIAGFDDDAAYMKSIADRAAELAAQAGQTADAVTRTDLLLSSANWILARELEPACSRKVLKLAEGPERLDDTAVLAALDRADELLTEAGKTIDSDVPEEVRSDLHHRRETLESFAEALRVYLLPDTDPEAARSTRRAASRLSVLLEDANPQVVAAAGLWQACLRSREADLEPALSVLGPALADPPGRSMPYAFFARILRCRLLAARDGFAMAIGLLTQLEDRTAEWLDNDTDRADAARTVTLAEFQVLADWHDHLSAADHPSERAWCGQRMDTLTKTRLGEGGKQNTVLRLAPAVPILPPHDKADASTPGSSSEQG
jgi:hypothetical protein